MNPKEAEYVLGVASLAGEKSVSAAFSKKMTKLERIASRESFTAKNQKKISNTATQLQRARDVLLDQCSRSQPVDRPADLAVALPTSFKPNEGGPTRKQLESSASRANRPSSKGSRRRSSRRKSSTRSTPIPKVLNDRYELQESIGSGGMGVVFRAFDRVRQEQVAVKVLTKTLTHDTEAHQRFAVEAKLASRLSHQNIVRVFDMQQHDDITFLTMELLAGRDLRSEIESRSQQGRQFSNKEVIAWAHQICAALEYAHNHTIHRDIKPENVWLCPDGMIKIMDFGIASVPQGPQMTGLGVAIGTAGYMAPEQAHGGQVDATADQYSLCVLLFELLTGEMPNRGSRKIHELRSDINRGLAQSIMKGLAHEPQDRFANVAELARGLRKKKLTTIPFRALAPLIALTVALIISKPYWPNLSEKAAKKANETYALSAEALDIKCIRHASYFERYMRPPEITHAHHLAEAAKVAFSQGDFGQSRELFSQATEQLIAGEIALDRLVAAAGDENLHTYFTEQKESGGVLPANLQQRIDDLDSELKSSRDYLLKEDFVRASDLYGKALDDLEATVIQAAAIAPYLDDWKSLNHANTALLDTENKWEIVYRGITEELADSPSAMSKAHRSAVFGAAETQFLASNARQKRTYQVDSFGWKRETKSIQEVEAVYQTSINMATKWMNMKVLEPLSQEVSKNLEESNNILKILEEAVRLDSSRMSLQQLSNWLNSSKATVKSIVTEEADARFMVESDMMLALEHFQIAKELSERLRSECLNWQQRIKNDGIDIDESGATIASIVVPDVTGKSITEAKQLLSEAGFVSVVTENLSQIESLTVVHSTVPNANTKVEKHNNEVELFLVVRVDDLVGKTYRAASQALTERGVNFVTSDSIRSAVVMAVEVESAEKSVPENFVQIGGQVRLELGVTVPNVQGQTLQNAFKVIQAAGLKPEIPSKYAASYNLRVQETNPMPKSLQKPGSTVVLLPVTSFEKEPTKMRTRERVVPAKELKPVTVYFENHHSEELLVQLISQRDGSSTKFRIAPGRAVSSTIERDGGSILIREEIDQNGVVQRELSRRKIPGKSLYTAMVSEYRIQSIYIDATGKDLSVPAEWRPKPINMGTRSIGAFKLPAGDRLRDASQLNAYSLAKRANNPGALSALGPSHIRLPVVY